MDAENISISGDMDKSSIGPSSHYRGQRQPTTLADQVQLAPGLATIDRICAHVVPRVWRARSWCPYSPATSPAAPAHPTDPGPPGGADQTRRRWPTRSGGASRSTASCSRVPGPAAARESKCGPCTRSRRSSCGRGWSGAGHHKEAAAEPAARAPPAPIARPAQGRQRVLPWRGIMPDRPKGAKRRLIDPFTLG